MAVGVLIELPGVKKKDYQELTAKLFGHYPMKASEAPEGLIVHTASSPPPHSRCRVRVRLSSALHVSPGSSPARQSSSSASPPSASSLRSPLSVELRSRRQKMLPCSESASLA